MCTCDYPYKNNGYFLMDMCFHEALHLLAEVYFSVYVFVWFNACFTGSMHVSLIDFCLRTLTLSVHAHKLIHCPRGAIFNGCVLSLIIMEIINVFFPNYKG